MAPSIAPDQRLGVQWTDRTVPGGQSDPDRAGGGVGPVDERPREEAMAEDASRVIRFERTIEQPGDVTAR